MTWPRSTTDNAASLTVDHFERRPLKVGRRIPNQSVAITLAILVAPLLVACSRNDRQDLDYSYNIQQTLTLDGLQSNALAQFESVEWDADDQIELQRLIVEQDIASGRKVWLLGAGPGLIAILFQQYGARSVVASDTNRAAVANAKYNVARVEMDANIDVRQADRDDGFSAIKSAEKFDLIVVDPETASRWQLDRTGSSSAAPTDQASGASAEQAPVDPIDLFLGQLLDHLSPGGRCLVACRQSEHIEAWRQRSADRGYQIDVLGEREFRSAPERIYPAVLVEIRIPMDVFNAAAAAGED